MILVRASAADRPSGLIAALFGNPDEAPSRGPRAAHALRDRAMALAGLDLGPSSVVWDVGAEAVGSALRPPVWRRPRIRHRNGPARL